MKSNNEIILASAGSSKDFIDTVGAFFMGGIMEEWRVIKGYEGYYEVSNAGRVRSLDKEIIEKGTGIKRFVGGKVLRQQLINTGYPKVDLKINGKKKSLTVHRLVAKAFIVNPHNKPFVNHKDGIRTNPESTNLEWVTRLENARHAVIALGSYKGEGNGQAKLKETDINPIRNLISQGKKDREIANTFGVHQRTIYDIRKKRTWAFVN